MRTLRRTLEPVKGSTSLVTSPSTLIVGGSLYVLPATTTLWHRSLDTQEEQPIPTMEYTLPWDCRRRPTGLLGPKHPYLLVRLRFARPRLHHEEKGEQDPNR